MSNISQDVIALSDFVQERRRTTSAGTKSRYTITIDAEPILHNLSEEKLGVGPAMAIQAAIVHQIKAITEVAKPSTILRRQNAKRMLLSGVIEDNKAAKNTWVGKKWIAEGNAHLVGVEGKATIARYSGGRTGLKVPTGSVRLFNDSGRFADGILVQQNTVERNWTINVTANRLDPTTFGSQGAFIAMTNRLRALVPVLANPLTDRDVLNAIEAGVKDVLVRKLEDANSIQQVARGDDLRHSLVMARLASARALL